MRLIDREDVRHAVAPFPSSAGRWLLSRVPDGFPAGVLRSSHVMPPQMGPAAFTASGGRSNRPQGVSFRLSPAQRMQALREGRLIHLGANPAQPRRIGLSGAPT